MFGSAAPQDHEYRDAQTHGAPARGRGAATLNPGNRFEDIRLHVLGEHLDSQLAEHPNGMQVATQSLPDDTRRIINKVVEESDVGFDWTINPYRGCEHGCIYCYARPYHEYLGFSLGLDFETRIMAKHDAPTMLRQELGAPRWAGQPIVFSGVTDCYQPLEARLKITRGCLEVCAEFRQPVGMITKNHLITRDIDVLSSLAQVNAARAFVSITTLDARLAATMEPRASSPRDRLRAVRELRDAGIPVGVMTAPIIPGLNDREIPALLEAAADAGAQTAGWTMLRLPYQLRTLFLDWLQRCVPEKASRIEHMIREVRGGELSDPRFKSRMRGEGELARTIKTMHEVYCRKFKLDDELPQLSSAHFRKPSSQLSLFDA